jgi:thioredoxin-related protein
MLSPKARAELLMQLARALSIFCILSCTIALADAGRLAPLDDLQQLSMLSKQSQLPILLLVSQYHCGFCDRMKKEVLQPMQMDPAYQNRVLIRELSIDPEGMVTSLDGTRQAASEFISQYNVSLTPTLLFLDATGAEVAERIVGINTVDFLPLYIDDAIDQATARMGTTDN